MPEIHDDVRGQTVRLRSAKQRLLLGALVALPGRAVSSGELIRELWNEAPPDKADNALQAHVSRLRQLLISIEPERGNSPRLIKEGNGYLLRAHRDETDSGRFERLAEHGYRRLAHDAPAAWSLLRQSLQLWRGAAMDGSLSGPVCAAAAIRLERERIRVLMTLLDCARPPGPNDVRPFWRFPGQESPRDGSESLHSLVARAVSHQQALHEALVTLAELVDPARRTIPAPPASQTVASPPTPAGSRALRG